MKFLDPLILEQMPDGHRFTVHEPFSYAVGAPDGATVVLVEAGFVTDFASIPRIFWGILPPNSWYGKAAVIHDKLYKEGKIGDMVINQKYADDVLNEGMCVLAAAWILEHGPHSQPGHPQIPQGELWSLAEREIIYRGVRLGGRFTWNNYRRQDAR